MTKVAIIGNTHRNLGVACAADLALAGHEVRYAPLTGPSAQLDALRAAGGFDLQGEASLYYSGKTGKSGLKAICDTAAEALDYGFIDGIVESLDQVFPSKRRTAGLGVGA